MTTRDPLNGRRVTVLGFGRREGVSLVRFLTSVGAQVLVSDQLPAERLRESLAAVAGLPVQFDLGGHDTSRILAWSDLLCVSPVIPRSAPLIRAAVTQGIAISSEVELFFERCPAPIIGITGSAGKTTTTTLIGKMLEQSGRPTLVGGNIGRPLLNELPGITPDHVVVMELSSFQLQPIRRSPHGAVVTNVTPNHLDRHADMDEYVDAKRQIVAHQQPSDWAMLNAGDPFASSFAAATPATVAWFGGEADQTPGDAAFIRDGYLTVRRSGTTVKLAPVSALRLRGAHNQENALAAALAAFAAGAQPPAVTQVLTTFQGVEHRLQLVGVIDGARYYDDSIATAPDRLLAALHTFTEPLVVILGGRDKHLPWSEAADVVCRRCRHVVLTGEAAPLIRQALEAAAQTRRRPVICEEPAFDDAVKAAIAVARPGDAVLLSPGCTSYDQFTDFAERGRRFAALIAATPGYEQG